MKNVPREVRGPRLSPAARCGLALCAVLPMLACEVTYCGPDAPECPYSQRDLYKALARRVNVAGMFVDYGASRCDTDIDCTLEVDSANGWFFSDPWQEISVHVTLDVSAGCLVTGTVRYECFNEYGLGITTGNRFLCDAPESEVYEAGWKADAVLDAACSLGIRVDKEVWLI